MYLPHSNPNVAHLSTLSIEENKDQNADIKLGNSICNIENLTNASISMRKCGRELCSRKTRLYLCFEPPSNLRNS